MRDKIYTKMPVVSGSTDSKEDQALMKIKQHEIKTTVNALKQEAI